MMKKFFLLFCSIYILIYILPFPLDQFGFGVWYNNIYDKLALAFGHSVLKIQDLKKIEETGSGDTTLNYVAVLLNLCFAFGSSLLLFLSFGKKIPYQKLFSIISLYARYYLAFFLISYGISKIMVTQFPPLRYTRLAESYGDSTPMGLFWTLMSASKPYTIISGSLEALAGVLLFFRRTTVVGCLLAIVVMTQIVLINLCYNVCVKLFSMHLLMISFFVLGEDNVNLFKLFFMRKPVSLASKQVFKKNKQLYISIGVQFLVLLALFTYMIQMESDLIKPAPTGQKRFYGIYKSKRFELKDGTVLADSNTIEQIVFDKRRDGKMYAAIKTANDSLIYFVVGLDTINKKMQFKEWEHEQLEFIANYKQMGKSFSLSGIWRGLQFQGLFTKRDKHDLLLTNTGFHWIQDQPNNQ
jgi:hypothetical protein